MPGRNYFSILTACVLAGLLLLVNGAAAADPKREPVAKSADQIYWDMGDGTVFDTETRLMWMKRDYWQTQREWVNWYTAMEFMQRMNNKHFAGYDDWRLPTPEEAKTLYNRRKRNIDKDGDKIFIDPIFPEGSGWGTWTSEERGGKAVVVSYKGNGGEAYQDKINGPDAFLRLVRGPLP